MHNSGWIHGTYKTYKTYGTVDRTIGRIGNVRSVVMKGGYVSPFQGSLFMYPYPGRRGPGLLCRGPSGRGKCPMHLTVALIRGVSPQRPAAERQKPRKGLDITAQGKHAGGVRRPG